MGGCWQPTRIPLPARVAQAAVVRGAAYALSQLRMSIATSLPVLQQACTRIRRAAEVTLIEKLWPLGLPTSALAT